MLKGLISNVSRQTLDTEEVVQIEAGLISPSPKQFREDFDIDGLTELADSIREHGVLEPLVVTPCQNGYSLIYGERRLRASGIAGLETVPCIVRDATAKQLAVWGLIENVQRVGLNPMELATAYETLQREHGMTQEQIAKETGKARSTVANTLRLLDLPEETQALVRSGQLDESSARELLRLKSEEDVIRTAQKAAEQRLTRRQVEEQVNAIVPPKPKSFVAPKVVAYSPNLDEYMDIPLAESNRQQPNNSELRAKTFTPPVVTKTYVAPAPIKVTVAEEVSAVSFIIPVQSSDTGTEPLTPYEVALSALRAIANYGNGTPNAFMMRAMHKDIIGIAEKALKEMEETL